MFGGVRDGWGVVVMGGVPGGDVVALRWAGEGKDGVLGKVYVRNFCYYFIIYLFIPERESDKDR